MTTRGSTFLFMPDEGPIWFGSLHVQEDFAPGSYFDRQLFWVIQELGDESIYVMLTNEEITKCDASTLQTNKYALNETRTGILWIMISIKFQPETCRAGISSQYRMAEVLGPQVDSPRSRKDTLVTCLGHQMMCETPRVWWVACDDTTQCSHQCWTPWRSCIFDFPQSRDPVPRNHLFGVVIHATVSSISCI